MGYDMGRGGGWGAEQGPETAGTMDQFWAPVTLLSLAGVGRDGSSGSLPGTSRKGQEECSAGVGPRSVTSLLLLYCPSFSPAGKSGCLVGKLRLIGKSPRSVLHDLSIIGPITFTFFCLRFFLCRMEIILEIKQDQTKYSAQSPAHSKSQ